MLRTVGVRDLRNSLSRYLRLVRSGETIVVLHHGHPVALLAPAPAGHTGITTAGHLASLAARGLLSSAIGPKRRSSRRRPRSDLSGAVGEDREGRS